MKTWILPLLAFTVVMISACEGSRARLGEEGFKKEMARQQQESLSRLNAATQRTYAGKSPEDVVAAARKVLMLWDKDRLTITDTPNGFTAERKAPWYAPTIYQQGTTKWGFQAVSDGNGGVKATTSAITYTYITVGNPGMLYSGMPRSDGLAAYALFWRRMDYLLGLTKTWTTCDAFEQERETSPELSEGSLRPLCGSFILDARPE